MVGGGVVYIHVSSLQTKLTLSIAFVVQDIKFKVEPGHNCAAEWQTTTPLALQPSVPRLRNNSFSANDNHDTNLLTIYENNYAE
jgi:hypothetical protein